MLNQTPIEAPRIAAANEPHLACVLLLDTSGSMAGDAINSLNKSINNFKEQLAKDAMAMKRVDVCIITFDDAPTVVQEFTPICEMEPVTLTAGGLTAMGAAINVAIDKVKDRNRFYAEQGTPCFKPWIFMITDGAPTDSIEAAAARIAAEESKGEHGKLKFWALGVPGFDATALHTLTKRVMALTDTDFSGIFDWLSASMATISVSQPGLEANAVSQLPANAQIVPADWN